MASSVATWEALCGAASCPTALGALCSHDVPTSILREHSAVTATELCSRWTSLVELSSGPAAQSSHRLRIVQTTAEAQLKGHLFREA